jgi:hypothetical protein
MPSPFSSRVIVTLPIAFDLPNTVTIQKLAGRHLERADMAAQTKFIDSINERGGTEVQKKLMELFEDKAPKFEPETPKVETKKSDPLAGLDHYTVCRFGIKAWTYDEPLTVDATTGRVAAIDDMDSESLAWFATEIVRITKPRLFESKDEAEASQKNA